MSQTIKVFRVEDKDGRGMYATAWFKCDLPTDDRHPVVSDDSKYIENLSKVRPDLVNMAFSYASEPSGHRFGFADMSMLRRWIYNDEWLRMLANVGCVLCVYEVPVDEVIVGYTQVTFNAEKACLVSRNPVDCILTNNI